ncbi:MAG: cytochrome b [Gammaproteobacteria bacterium]|nr:cytochrome b [Gammaproteobacteria bacterium]MCW5583661.1 cytochrome b [Gammaproteobacteria bacterium]
MPIRNTQYEYGAVAILLHWVMALLIIVLLMIGLYMTGLSVSLRKLKFYGWHKELGILVLALVVVRVAWRLANVVPRLRPYLPLWEAMAARFAHWTFYLLMGILPITGWVMSSAAGLPVSFFGLFVLPDIVLPNEELRIMFQAIHTWLAYTLIALICIHVVAALKHHFINKDDIMRRMLP